MPLEALICLFGLVTITYFMARPKTEVKSKDKLTKEVHYRGLPPSYPSDAGGHIPPR